MQRQGTTCMVKSWGSKPTTSKAVAKNLIPKDKDLTSVAVTKDLTPRDENMTSKAVAKHLTQGHDLKAKAMASRPRPQGQSHGLKAKAETSRPKPWPQGHGLKAKFMALWTPNSWPCGLHVWKRWVASSDEKLTNELSWQVARTIL